MVGTAKRVMISTKTKRLSTDRDFSVTYPAKNALADSPSRSHHSPAPNSAAAATQNTPHHAASRRLTSCGLRPTRKSTAIRMSRPTTVAAQIQMGTCMY